MKMKRVVIKRFPLLTFHNFLGNHRKSRRPFSSPPIVCPCLSMQASFFKRKKSTNMQDFLPAFFVQSIYMNPQPIHSVLKRGGRRRRHVDVRMVWSLKSKQLFLPLSDFLLKNITLLLLQPAQQKTYNFVRANILLLQVLCENAAIMLRLHKSSRTPLFCSVYYYTATQSESPLCKYEISQNCSLV